MSELTSAAGLVAGAAAVIGLAALALAVVLWVKLRRVQAAQTVVLGERGERDLVAQGRDLQRGIEALDERQQRQHEALASRMRSAEERLDRTLSKSSVVRYDAYGEMSGRQSSSIAILDEHGDGVIVSSIHHREQARVYAKSVSGGESELGISPEEEDAIGDALGRRATGPPPSS